MVTKFDLYQKGFVWVIVKGVCWIDSDGTGRLLCCISLLKNPQSVNVQMSGLHLESGFIFFCNHYNDFVRVIVYS